jgi:pyrimidine operon attenuation protein/uracil phosphoribosyltransferase
MAFEIYEQNFGQASVVFIGVGERGGYLAKEISRHLQEISPLEIQILSAHPDRESMESPLPVEFTPELGPVEGAHVVIVDDVLYTGRTLMSVISHVLRAKPAKLQTAILIDRGHRHFPVSSDFVGVELATTFHQHVFFELSADRKEVEAYLR